jgi:hypothetical protein
VEVGNRISAPAGSVFNNPTTLDLHLKSGSPAINTGIAISIVNSDYEGVARPQLAGSAFDIGAYEYK